MPPPPLDIYRYHVDSFALEAHEDFDAGRGTAAELNVDFDVEQSVDRPVNFRVAMTVKVADNGYTVDSNPPYSIALVIIGYFRFADGTSEDVMARMISLNGTSILFGIARGFVGQATGASRYNQFVLPAVNFVEIVQRKAAAEGEITSTVQVK